MNLATVIVVLIIAVLIVLDVKYLKKNGVKDCAGSCGSCTDACKWTEDLRQAKMAIDQEKQDSLRSGSL